MTFLWVKTFHLVAVVSWFAVLFYLPRLFVYHAMSDDRVSRERFELMERKLYYGIGLPASIATVVLGTWMAYLNWDAYKLTWWFWLKMLLVNILILYFHWLDRIRKRFIGAGNPHDQVFYRWINEVPVLFLIAIIILAVLKPFGLIPGLA